MDLPSLRYCISSGVADERKKSALYDASASAEAAQSLLKQINTTNATLDLTKIPLMLTAITEYAPSCCYGLLLIMSCVTSPKFGFQEWNSSASSEDKMKRTRSSIKAMIPTLADECGTSRERTKSKRKLVQEASTHISHRSRELGAYRKSLFERVVSSGGLNNGEPA